MGRHYVIDAYNFVLQDDRLDGIVSETGLEEARRVFRLEAEQMARRLGCRIRLIYDGNQGPFAHPDRFENQYIDATFTSSGEKADERVVAVALEMARRGDKVWVVSDDEDGVRRPLKAASVTLVSTRDFARLLRSRPDGDDLNERTEVLSRRDRDAVARQLLVRDAPRTGDTDAEGWQEISRNVPPPPSMPPPPLSAPPVRRPPAAPAPALPSAGYARSRERHALPAPPRTAAPREPDTRPDSARPESVRCAPAPPDPAARLRAKKERGARKQARRVAMLQPGKNRLESSKSTDPSRKPKR